MRLLLEEKETRNFAVYFESESLSFLAPKTWELVPNSIRKEKTLHHFSKVKSKLGQLKSVYVYVNLTKIT